MPPTTVVPSWSLLCWNLTDGSRSAVVEGASSRASVAVWPPVNVTGADATRLDDRDRHALLYIVVVLLFYSSGIVVAIVTYLKREKAEIEEEKGYDDYARSAASADSAIRANTTTFTTRIHAVKLQKSLPVIKTIAQPITTCQTPV